MRNQGGGLKWKEITTARKFQEIKPFFPYLFFSLRGRLLAGKYGSKKISGM